jgi:hypothetical protein
MTALREIPDEAVVVYRDELPEADRDALLEADNWQGTHVQAPVWIYWFGDLNAARPDAFRERCRGGAVLTRQRPAAASVDRQGQGRCISRGATPSWWCGIR